MRITISIADELLASARIRAQERGRTLDTLVADALRRELSLNSEPVPRPVVPVFRGGNGLMPGVDITSNRALYEFLDEGVPLDKRR
jgi:hypothetical protein